MKFLWSSSGFTSIYLKSETWPKMLKSTEQLPIDVCIDLKAWCNNVSILICSPLGICEKRNKNSVFDPKSEQTSGLAYSLIQKNKAREIRMYRFQLVPGSYKWAALTTKKTRGSFKLKEEKKHGLEIIFLEWNILQWNDWILRNPNTIVVGEEAFTNGLFKQKSNLIKDFFIKPKVSLGLQIT